MSEAFSSIEPTALVDIGTLKGVVDGQEVTVAGWVRSKRETKRVCFIALNDGGADTLQVVIEYQRISSEQRDALHTISTGAALIVQGRVVHTPHMPQTHELQCASFTLCGVADPAHYPLQKKEHSTEFLRTLPHLRARTATYGAIARVRSALIFALHRFFHTNGFTHVHTPIITTHDAEGAGALFQVTHDRSTHDSATHDSATPRSHFFGTPAYLTVSGQLNAECYALAMGKVYTFGPTFRAEESHTGRHLSEFWMAEPEIAFCDLSRLLSIAERCVKSIIADCLQACQSDIEFLCSQHASLAGTLEKLQTVKYQVLEYTDAVALLERAPQPFEYPIQWGEDLQSEHERWLLAYFDQTPLFIINYPRHIKAFYMRLNDDARTVAAMDLIVPEVGELIGGSQREERGEPLLQRMHECGVDAARYQWYMDLRRYGGAPHAGFGLGFDRLVQLVCGVANIRDVVAFPRTPGQALC